MKKSFVVDCDIKERQGDHYVKIDKFKGAINDCVAFLIQKYSAKIPSRLERVFSHVGSETNIEKAKRK